MLVSFSCYHCDAVLSIPEEQTGISGPCPFCGTVVTSPSRNLQHESELPAESAPDQQTARDDAALKEASVPPPAATKSFPADDGLKKTGKAKSLQPRRPRRIALKAAAGVALYAGGVAGVWKIWEGEKPPAAADKPRAEAYIPVRPHPAPRPSTLAAADEPHTGDAEPGTDDANEVPPIPPMVVPGVVARDVSTASSGASVLVPAPEAAAPLSTNASGTLHTATAVSNVPTVAMSETEREIRRIVPTGGALAAPGNALIRFLAAENWQERLHYTLAPHKVKPLMEAYYKVHPDGPVIPRDIELTRMEPVEDDPTRHYFAFMVYFPDRVEGVPLSVEETKSGCFIEWTSFVEGKDMLLEKFYSGWRKEPGTFRLLIRRGHYFETDMPDRERKVVFDINPPDRTGPYKLWVDKNSPIWKKTFAEGDKLPWNQVAMMVLTLQWEKTAQGVAYVRLREVAADSWHPELLK
jgi:hypothetical protein